MTTVSVGKRCDICNEQATKVLSRYTTDLCTSWFVGFYCESCEANVLAAMRKELENDPNFNNRRQPQVK